MRHPGPEYLRVFEIFFRGTASRTLTRRRRQRSQGGASARISPATVGCRDGQTEDLGGLRKAQTGELAELDEPQVGGGSGEAGGEGMGAGVFIAAGANRKPAIEELVPAGLETYQRR